MRRRTRSQVVDFMRIENLLLLYRLMKLAFSARYQVSAQEKLNVCGMVVPDASGNPCTGTQPSVEVPTVGFFLVVGKLLFTAVWDSMHTRPAKFNQLNHDKPTRRQR